MELGGSLTGTDNAKPPLSGTETQSEGELVAIHKGTPLSVLVPDVETKDIHPQVTSTTGSTMASSMSHPSETNPSVTGDSVAPDTSQTQVAAKPSELELQEEAKKTGRAKRREKRLRNEPQNVTGDGPSGVNVLDFAEARVTELHNMVRAIESKGGSKRTFQKLPRHMRRRAMSHNVKRLPRSLREQAAKEMDKSKKSEDSKKSVPCRKRRRKRANLREEYTKRQGKYKWLETHLWHSTRMKMCEKYGYKYAMCCADKGVRAAYKSLLHGCLLSDVSYYHCTEITGTQSTTIDCLNPLFSPETGLTIRAKAYLKGQREGRAIMYKAGAYPRGAIGPVHFLWQAPPPDSKPPTPQNPTKSETTEGCAADSAVKLWIWCHPAMREQVLSEVNKAIEAHNMKMLKSLVASYAAAILIPNGLPGGSAVTIQQPSNGNYVPSNYVCSVTSRNVVRFRLLGPRSHALLMETLKPVKSFDTVDSSLVNGDGFGSRSSRSGTVSDREGQDYWWSDKERKNLLTSHSDLLFSFNPAITSASSPADFSRGTVIGMTVLDPRLFTPTKRTDMVSSFYPQKRSTFTTASINSAGKMSTDTDNGLESTGVDNESQSKSEAEDMMVDKSLESFLIGEQQKKEQSRIAAAKVSLDQLPPELAYSLIWDMAVCDVVSESKVSDSALNEERSKRFVRTLEMDLGDRAARVPVLLIQQTLKLPLRTPLLPRGLNPASHRQQVPDLSNENVGYGWDIVLPPKWAMAFWVSLIYRGARACGADELKKCSMEALVLHFPEDYPDTEAGQLYSLHQKRALEERYRKDPPDKRQNYGKFLIATPFHCAWERVVRYWTSESRISSILASERATKRCLEVERNDEPLRKKAKIQCVHYADTKTCSPTDPRAPPCIDAELSQDDNLPAYFHVLRSRDVLNSLNRFIACIFAEKKSPSRKHAPPQTIITTNHQSSFIKTTLREYDIDVYLREHSSALIAVKVEVNHSGTISDLAGLHVPSQSDLHSLLSVKRSRPYSGPSEEINPKGLTRVEGEAIVIGISSLTRSKMKEVKKVLKQKSKKKKKKRPRNDTSKTDSKESTPTAPAIPSRSPIPGARDNFRLFPVKPSRQLFGHVTSSGYRHYSSLSSGVGFVTFAGLLETTLRCYSAPGVNELLALVRGESTKYYFVKLHLL